MTVQTFMPAAWPPAPLGARWHAGVAIGAVGLGGVLLIAFGEAAARPFWGLAALAGAGLIGWLTLREAAAPRVALLALWAVAGVAALGAAGGVGGPFSVFALAPLAAAAALDGGWIAAVLLALGAAILARGGWPVAPGTGGGLTVAALAGFALALAAALRRPAATAEVQAPDTAPPVRLAELERERDQAVEARRGAETALQIAEEGRRAARAVLQVTVDSRDSAEALLREATAGRAQAEAARDAAEAQATARVRFLANMSHELRTPLNAIMGFSDIMRQRLFGPLSDKYGEYAGLIHESGRHLLDLINDVLDLAKVEAGRFELIRERFDGREPVQAAIRLLKSQADDAGLSLRAVLPSAAVEVDADRRAVKQIVINLVGNALKFTPPGGEVTVIAGPRDQTFELSVTDTGVGIAAADVERLGRPFEQVGDSDARLGGTGLGLSLVKAMAALHGGGMVIESRVGQGTAVTVSLPVLANAAGSVGAGEGRPLDAEGAQSSTAQVIPIAR